MAEPFSPRTIGEEVERETIEEPFDEVLTGGGTATAMPASDFVSTPPEPAASPAAPEPPVEVGPSSTLGELYLAQGHLDEAAAEFRKVTDPLMIWLDRELVRGPGLWVRKDALAAAYRRECQKADRIILSDKAFSIALQKHIPLLIVSASGGARMQEGILSLMQMAKTSAALQRLDAERVPYISLLTDPTTGGVTASFAMLGDLILAEPRALIGFAGPRVIAETIRQPLPEGFQRSEFLLEHGQIDLVVERRELRATLRRILAFFGGRTPAPAP